MEETNRSGIDRRQDVIGDDGINRAQPERRQVVRSAADIIERYRKIPIFAGLSLDQFMKMIHISSKKTFAAGTTIYSYGDPSDSMFILLRGTINIMFNSGEVWHSITPPGTVGELGVFTGEQRSATIVADTDCAVLLFSGTELFRVFGDDPDLYNKILLNVIHDLSVKLRRDNEKIEELYYRIFSLERL